MEANQPKIGVGVLVLKDGKILFGKRTGEYGKDLYSFPGGKLEYMESFEECVRRETREEVGIEIKNIRFLNVANVTTYNPKHYINVEFVADWESGEPQTFANEKIGDWKWYGIDELPTPMFLFSEQGIESLKTNKNYFDAE
jgi:8-oxo-dGTP diphosphatase